MRRDNNRNGILRYPLLSNHYRVSHIIVYRMRVSYNTVGICTNLCCREFLVGSQNTSSHGHSDDHASL